MYRTTLARRGNAPRCPFPVAGSLVGPCGLVGTGLGFTSRPTFYGMLRSWDQMAASSRRGSHVGEQSRYHCVADFDRIASPFVGIRSSSIPALAGRTRAVYPGTPAHARSASRGPGFWTRERTSELNPEAHE